MNALKSLKILTLFLFLAGCAGHDSKSTPEVDPKIYTTPTIYYIPQFDMAQTTCAASSQKDLKDKNGNLLFQVCESVYNACLMQGTCEIKDGAATILVNVAGQVDGEQRFSKVQNSVCRFGYGAGKNICLDPYYSLAADLSIYKLGQVIYIPSLAGTALPDGSKHDGYFVVRDSGGAIKGYGRFDFFTGFVGNQRAKNPLVRAGLGDKKTHLLYYVIEGSQADTVLKTRNYPALPVAE